MVNNVGYVFWCALCGLFALRVVLIWLKCWVFVFACCLGVLWLVALCGLFGFIVYG